MDISNTIAEMKKLPGFKEQVGMILVHNGVIRATSRKDGATVTQVHISVDQEKLEAVRQQCQGRPGIFRVLAKAASGVYAPGDDVLFIVVAGDFRENVKAVLAEALDRIKTEAVSKKEIMAG